MNALITPTEVINIAFSPLDQINGYTIKESKIISTQLAFIEPVLGSDMIAALGSGRYADILSNYIKPALAYYVRMSIIPDITSKLSNSGPQTPFSDHTNASTDRQRDLARNQAKKDGDAFIDKAISIIEGNLSSYPEYRGMANVRNRIIVKGGIVGLKTYKRRC